MHRVLGCWHEELEWEHLKLCIPPLSNLHGMLSFTSFGKKETTDFMLARQDQYKFYFHNQTILFEIDY